MSLDLDAFLEGLHLLDLGLGDGVLELLAPQVAQPVLLLSELLLFPVQKVSVFLVDHQPITSPLGRTHFTSEIRESNLLLSTALH